MKNKTAILFLAILFCSSANAAWTWTDAGDPYGTGLKVSIVYPDFAGKSVIFKCADGRFFRYYWDSAQTEMTANAKAVYSLLLTALVSEKNVSIYYDDAGGGYLPVQQINVHN